MEGHRQTIETGAGPVVVHHPKAPTNFEDTCRELKGKLTMFFLKHSRYNIFNNLL